MMLHGAKDCLHRIQIKSVLNCIKTGEVTAEGQFIISKENESGDISNNNIETPLAR